LIPLLSFVYLYFLFIRLSRQNDWNMTFKRFQIRLRGHGLKNENFDIDSAPVIEKNSRKSFNDARNGRKDSDSVTTLNSIANKSVSNLSFSLVDSLAAFPLYHSQPGLREGWTHPGTGSRFSNGTLVQESIPKWQGNSDRQRLIRHNAPVGSDELEGVNTT
jgi:hypothetical protein